MERSYLRIDAPDLFLHLRPPTRGTPAAGVAGAATIPLAFHEARQAGKAPEGALVAFAALGARRIFLSDSVLCPAKNGPSCGSAAIRPMKSSVTAANAYNRETGS